MKLQESGENYLETILILKNRKGLVRSIDIVNELEFSKPSVSVAMKNLRENGYIEIDNSGFISLLPSGLQIANWLIALGVDSQTAVEDACRIEHVISAESFKAVKEYVEKHTP